MSPIAGDICDLRSEVVWRDVVERWSGFGWCRLSSVRVLYSGAEHGVSTQIIELKYMDQPTIEHG